MHSRATARDILGSLPRDERDELLLLIETTPGETAGLHWLAVSPAVWEALTAAARRDGRGQASRA